MLDQLKSITLDQERAIDFIAISENIPKLKNNHNYFSSPKTLMKVWDGLKKKLKDPNKRENEFQALCRNEVSVDFWTDHIQNGRFKARLNVYLKHLTELSTFYLKE
jgi:hypothetical protein